MEAWLRKRFTWFSLRSVNDFPTVARVRDAFRRGTLHWLLPIHRCHSGRIGRKSKGCWGNGRYGQHLRSALSLVVRPFHLFFGDGTAIQWAVIVAVDTFEKSGFAVNQQLSVFGKLYFAEAYLYTT